MTGDIELIKAARALAKWTQPQLAEAAGLSSVTIKRFESATGLVSEEAVGKMKSALEKAGIEFIPENGGGAGVRLKKPRVRRKG